MLISCQKKVWAIDRFRVQSLQKILNQENLRPEDRTAAIRMLRHKCKILVKGFRNRGNMKELLAHEKIINKYSDI